MRTIAIALLAGACVGGGCGSKSRPTELTVHQHNPGASRVTIDTSQIPGEWKVGVEHRESKIFGHTDRKDTVRLRPGHRVKVIVVPDDATSGQ